MVLPGTGVHDAFTRFWDLNSHLGSALDDDDVGHVIVDSPVGTIIDIGPRGFGVLSLFSEPIRLGDAIERLEIEHGHSTRTSLQF